MIILVMNEGYRKWRNHIIKLNTNLDLTKIRIKYKSVVGRSTNVIILLLKKRGADMKSEETLLMRKTFGYSINCLNLLIRINWLLPMSFTRSDFNKLITHLGNGNGVLQLI